MTLLRKSLRRAALAGVVLALAVLVAPPVALADCWGCVQRSCTFGFRTGGFLCTEVKGECGLAARLTGTCALESCYTSDPCENGKRPAQQPILKPEPVDPKDGGPSTDVEATGTAAPAGAAGNGLDATT